MNRGTALARARALYGPNVYGIGGPGLAAIALLEVSKSPFGSCTATVEAVMLGCGPTWKAALAKVEQRAAPKVAKAGAA